MPRSAAVRILEALAQAKRGGYYNNGWYFYVDRPDVEKLALAVLTPTEAAVYRKALADA